MCFPVGSFDKSAKENYEPPKLPVLCQKPRILPSSQSRQPSWASRNSCALYKMSEDLLIEVTNLQLCNGKKFHLRVVQVFSGQHENEIPCFCKIAQLPPTQKVRRISTHFWCFSLELLKIKCHPGKSEVVFKYDNQTYV